MNIRGLVIERQELEGHSPWGQGWRETCPLPERMVTRVIKWNGGLPKTGAHQGFNMQSFTEKDYTFSKFEMSRNHILSCNAIKIGINVEVEAGLLVGAGLPGWSFRGHDPAGSSLSSMFQPALIFKDRLPAPSNPSLGFLLPSNCSVGVLVLFLLAVSPTWVNPPWRQGPFLLGWKLYPQSLEHCLALSRLNNVVRWTTVSNRNIMLQGPSCALTLLP